MKKEDILIVKGATFWATHGYYQEENKFGQKFIVDVEVNVDMKKQCETDELDKGYSYVTIYNIIKKVIVGEQHKLLQRIAQRIADEVIKSYPVNQVKVIVKKPHVAIGGIVDYTAVQVVREPKMKDTGGGINEIIKS
ncbi:dihydroneopterin aldolase [bacterium]|nr:dihydroneopterin aldolase [bacterium]